MTQYSIADELNLLDPKKVKVYKDEFNRLRLKMAGNQEEPEVEAFMGFPLTGSNSFVSFIEVKDGKKDKEIGIIENIRKLDSKSRRVLREEMKRLYLMPLNIRINRLKGTRGVIKFDVETENGQREFETKHREDIRKFPGGRVIIKDSDGNRYEIRDYRKLDKKSVILIDGAV